MAGQNKTEFYRPSVLNAFKKLSPEAVDGALKYLADKINEISPPAGSGAVSTVISNLDPTQVKSFNIKLETRKVILSGEVWNASTTGATWNAHTLTYNGSAYNINAGSTTNKFVYWQLSKPTAYQTSATFPTLGANDWLIGLWDTGGTNAFYPFWNTQLAPAFISTALIADASITTAKIQDLAVSTAKIANLAVTNAKIFDLAADKITTGTLAASVAVTLTRSDTVPAKLIWANTGQMYSKVTGDELWLVPDATNADYLQIGTASLAWASIDMQAYGSFLVQCIASTTLPSFFMSNSSTDSVEMHSDTGTGFKLSTTSLKPIGSMDIGLTGTRWVNGWFSGNVTATGTITAGLFSGSGFGLTSINTGSITSGILPVARGGTDQTSYTANGVIYYNTGFQSGSGFTYNGTDVTTTGSFRCASGQGVGTSTDAWAFTTNTTIEGFVSSTSRVKFDTTNSATDTCMFLYFNGLLRRVKCDTSDLGSGSKSYLYFV